LAALACVPNSGLVVNADAFTGAHRTRIIALATLHRLPAIYPFRLYASEGGLMSYGYDVTEQFRQAASYVNRILRGEKPADLPVQTPTRYEMVINLKTARAIGLDVPPNVLAIADEVIE
jgi:putative tryptophan/tyrosine transport system substrate-binding protein